MSILYAYLAGLITAVLVFASGAAFSAAIISKIVSDLKKDIEDSENQ